MGKVKEWEGEQWETEGDRKQKKTVEFDRCELSAAWAKSARVCVCVREIRETLQGVELPSRDQGPRKKNKKDDEEYFFF